MNKNYECCDIINECLLICDHKNYDINDMSITCAFNIINGIIMGVFYGGNDIDNSGINYIRYNVMYYNDVVYNNVYSRHDNINIHNILYNVNNYMVNNHNVSIYDYCGNDCYHTLYINKYYVYDNDDEMVIQINISK